jgi:2-dehydro-3-deoxy-D-arabinonate dehydratase
MKLGQIYWNKSVTAAVFDAEGNARPIPGHTVYDLIVRSEKEGVSIQELAKTMATGAKEKAKPLIPIKPREVWACGCTYEMSASFRDAEHNTREGFYAAVYRGERPEVFFKGTSRVCVGPDEPIGIRVDSKFTAPEPELAVILGTGGKILGYTVANDVSAWDIERENPLYLPQSKTYTACCSLGPYIVTADEIPDGRTLDMSCVIKRGDQETFNGSTSTSKMGRPIEYLIEYLLRANEVPAGSVLMTGTGIIVTQEAALAEGDVCTISVPQIGTLSNPATIVK